MSVTARPATHGAGPAALRQALLGLATSSSMRLLLRPLMTEHVAILMLHRFADPERGIRGHDPRLVHDALALLRRERIPVLPLRELVTALAAGDTRTGIAFTVDDGYDDFETVGAALFAAYDCPVTMFPATGFLDRTYWPWWDQIEYGCERTRRPDLALGSGQQRYPLGNPLQRRAAAEAAVAWIGSRPQGERADLIAGLLRELDVEPPAAAPAQYAPLSWAAVRRLADSGIEFGVHTVSHPQIASLPREDILLELQGAWDRLCQELRDPLPVLCYPFGRLQDLSPKVPCVARAVGLRAALTSVPGYAGRVDPEGDGMYCLPRFSMPSRMADVRQIAFGVERLKMIVRERVRAGQQSTVPASRTGAPPPPAEPAGQPPVRVLYVDYSIGFGGATKSMAQVLRELRGVEPVVMTSQSADIRRLWYGQWPVHPFRRWINYRTPWRVDSWLRRHHSPRAVRWIAGKAVAAVNLATAAVNGVRIARVCRSHRIQVLHLVNGVVPLDALFAARLTGLPFIAHMRGFFRPVPPRLQRRLPAVPALVLGCSAAVRDSYLRHTWFASPAASIPDVVDMPRFAAAAARRQEVRAELQLAPDDVAVAIFGRVLRWKGQLEFVQAMIDAMVANPALIGVIVGDASDGMQQYFEDVAGLIRSSGLEARFRLTGYRADVEPYYAAVDIVVQFSMEPEPNGMVVQEAMASGTPVIAVEEGGPRELVRPGIDGLLVPPRDVAALRDAVLTLAADPATRRRMGEAARERAALLYDIPVAAAQLRDIYRLLLRTQAGTARERSAEWLQPTLDGNR